MKIFVCLFALIAAATANLYGGYAGGYGAPVAYGGYGGYGAVPVAKVAAAPIAYAAPITKYGPVLAAPAYGKAYGVSPVLGY